MTTLRLTRDNGKPFAVLGERGAATLPACVRTFAYWDQRFLTEPRLLNSQTGELQSVTLSRDGPKSLEVHAP